MMMIHRTIFAPSISIPAALLLLLLLLVVVAASASPAAAANVVRQSGGWEFTLWQDTGSNYSRGFLRARKNTSSTWGGICPNAISTATASSLCRILGLGDVGAWTKAPLSSLSTYSLASVLCDANNVTSFDQCMHYKALDNCEGPACCPEGNGNMLKLTCYYYDHGLLSGDKFVRVNPVSDRFEWRNRTSQAVAASWGGICRGRKSTHSYACEQRWSSCSAPTFATATKLCPMLGYASLESAQVRDGFVMDNETAAQPLRWHFNSSFTCPHSAVAMDACTGRHLMPEDAKCAATKEYPTYFGELSVQCYDSGSIAAAAAAEAASAVGIVLGVLGGLGGAGGGGAASEKGKSCDLDIDCSCCAKCAESSCDGACDMFRCCGDGVLNAGKGCGDCCVNVVRSGGGFVENCAADGCKAFDYCLNFRCLEACGGDLGGGGGGGGVCDMCGGLPRCDCCRDTMTGAADALGNGFDLGADAFAGQSSNCCACADACTVDCGDCVETGVGSCTDGCRNGCAVCCKQDHASQCTLNCGDYCFCINTDSSRDVAHYGESKCSRCHCCAAWSRHRSSYFLYTDTGSDYNSRVFFYHRYAYSRRRRYRASQGVDEKMKHSAGGGSQSSVFVMDGGGGGGGGGGGDDDEADFAKQSAHDDDDDDDDDDPTAIGLLHAQQSVVFDGPDAIRRSIDQKRAEIHNLSGPNSCYRAKYLREQIADLQQELRRLALVQRVQEGDPDTAARQQRTAEKLQENINRMRKQITEAEVFYGVTSAQCWTKDPAADAGSSSTSRGKHRLRVLNKQLGRLEEVQRADGFLQQPLVGAPVAMLASPTNAPLPPPFGVPVMPLGGGAGGGGAGDLAIPIPVALQPVPHMPADPMSPRTNVDRDVRHLELEKIEWLGMPPSATRERKLEGIKQRLEALLGAPNAPAAAPAGKMPPSKRPPMPVAMAAPAAADKGGSDRRSTASDVRRNPMQEMQEFTPSSSPSKSKSKSKSKADADAAPAQMSPASDLEFDL